MSDSKAESPHGTPEALPDLLTVRQTADYLGLSLPNIYYLAANGHLPVVILSPGWRIRRSEIDVAAVQRIMSAHAAAGTSPKE